MYEAEDRYWWFVSRRRLALRMLPPEREGERWLDLGCGTGAGLAAFSGRAEVTGLDFSPEALGLARERGDFRLVQGDAQSLPFADGAFDAVVTLDMMEHVPDDAAVAREVFRCLAPGGRLLVNVPAFPWLWGPHDVALMHHRRYRRDDLRRVLEGAGFTVERISYSMFALFPLVAAQRLGARLGPGRPVVTMPRVPDAVNRALIGAA